VKGPLFQLFATRSPVSSLSSMERHVVPANACVLEIVAVAKAERAKAVTRNTYSDEVTEVTQSARQSGSGSKAAKAYYTRHAGDADFEPLNQAF